MGYATAMWLSFGEALAAVAGALTGLLFVAVSVKSNVLAASLSLRLSQHQGRWDLLQDQAADLVVQPHHRALYPLISASGMGVDPRRTRPVVRVSRRGVR